MELLKEEAEAPRDCTMKIIPPQLSTQPPEEEEENLCPTCGSPDCERDEEEEENICPDCGAVLEEEEEEEEEARTQIQDTSSDQAIRNEVLNMEKVDILREGHPGKQSNESPEDGHTGTREDTQGQDTACQEEEEEDQEAQHNTSHRGYSTQQTFGNGLLRSANYRFSGYGWLDKLTSKELLEAVEHTANSLPRTKPINQWRAIIEEKMMHEVFWCLEGYPRQWYQTEALRPTWTKLDWVSFKELFNLHFYIPPIRMSPTFDINDLKQRPGETVQHFHTRVCWIYDHLTYHRGQSSDCKNLDHLPATDLQPTNQLGGISEKLRNHICTNLFIAGLREEIKDETGRRCQTHQSLDYYLDFARTVENMINLSQGEKEIIYNALQPDKKETSIIAEVEKKKKQEKEDGSEENEEQERVSETPTRNLMSKGTGEM